MRLHRALALASRLRGLILTSLILALALVASASPAIAAETIRNFSSATTLLADGSVDVVETIDVTVENVEIRHGIFRDIPTVMVNPDNSRLHSSLDVIEVLRDGRPEPFHTQSITNGLRIYAGDADTFVSRGLHRYVIHYTMTRMARRFADHDELYWNATGNFWNFPIENAVASITLPSGAVISELDVYTGYLGDKGKDATITRTSDNTALFRSTRTLRPGEGMTVAALFQKGILAEPDAGQRAIYYLSDHRDAILPAAAVFLVLLYYFFAWDAVGRDPRKGTIIPLFHPPKGFSPALVHFVHRMGWSKNGWTAFTAGLVDLGVKGLIVIDKDTGETRISSTGKTADDLPPEEASLFRYLDSRQSLTIDKTTGPGLNTKRSEFISGVASASKQRYFKNNFGHTAIGFAIAIVCLFVLVISGVLEPVWLIAAIGIGVAFGILTSVIRQFMTATGIARYIAFGILGLMGTNIAGGAITALSEFTINTAAIAAISIIVISMVFAALMRAATVEGRQVMDEIDGFRMYLETAEKERLNMPGEPQLTTSRFEQILPFAIALGVEKPWSKYFESQLARNAVADARGGSYNPMWYRGADFSSSDISRSVSSVASGVSAAMIAAQPASSSSSGGGGGGGSGGGGGGGGGGGW
ncbi:MAG TPA: DUF2207 domain-containing protein [Devosiaceae bacterium]